MGLVLRQVIGYQQGSRVSPLTADPKLEKELKEVKKELNELKTKGGTKESPLLKKQLEQTQKDLSLILNKWKFGDTPLNSAQEFLNSFEPWINKQMEQKKELQEFLNEQGVSNLNNLKETWKNTEADYLRRIKEFGESKGDDEELKAQIESLTQDLEDARKANNKSREKLEEVEDLITERDEAIREKKTTEADLLATNNRLNLKVQEVKNKEESLERIKREKNQLEVNQQKALKEKNGLITTLNQEIKQHKEKYTKQSKLLDTEQLECKRLEEENEKLKEEIKKIKEEGWKSQLGQEFEKEKQTFFKEIKEVFDWRKENEERKKFSLDYVYGWEGLRNTAHESEKMLEKIQKTIDDIEKYLTNNHE